MSVNRPWVIGHRGSRGTHSENTFPSFQEAVDSGADAIEIDVQLSQDGVPFVFHDDEVSDRLCRRMNGQDVASEIPFYTVDSSSLAEFDCGSVSQEEFPDQELVGKSEIPSLAKFLDWFEQNTRNQVLFLEIKVSKIKGSEERSHSIRRYLDSILPLCTDKGFSQRVLIQSFDQDLIRALKSHWPSERLSWITESESAFPSESLVLGVNGTTPNNKLCIKESVEACHGAGLKVFPWTVNDSTRWGELLELGVDGIITDYPRRLRAFLTQ